MGGGYPPIDFKILIKIKEMKHSTCILLLLILFSCNSNNQEKRVKDTDKNYVNVTDKIKDIQTEYYHGAFSLLYILDNYLIILDGSPNPESEVICIYDKNNFKFITITGIIGKGPNEIGRPGRIGLNKTSNEIWLPDHGKMVMWKFPLDSVFNNPDFKPTEKIKLNNELFLSRFAFINDSIALGTAVHVINYNSFDMAMAKLNVTTNTTEKFGYEHPQAIGKKSNSMFALSNKHNIYVNSYSKMDLMIICNLEGSLKCNIKGPGWMKNKDNKKRFYSQVEIHNEYIIASYWGGLDIFFDKHKRPRVNRPTKLLVFDIDGNHLKTIDTGHKILNFCTDEENNRIIAYFTDRDVPLGYFSLEGILD